MAKKFKNQKDQLLSILAKGSHTTKTLRTRHGIANPSAVIARLRDEGHDIYTDVDLNAKGQKVFTYAF